MNWTAAALFAAAIFIGCVAIMLSSFTDNLMTGPARTWMFCTVAMLVIFAIVVAVIGWSNLS